MGRGPGKQKKDDIKVVKSFRLNKADINTIKALQDAEDMDQSSALRALIQYGIIYYTMLESEE